MARPTDYTPELAALICARVAENRRGQANRAEGDGHRAGCYEALPK